MNDDPGRVLVVDENYDTLDLLAKTLRALGARVSLATDGQSGLKHAVEMHAEVVLVDRDVRVFDIRTFLDVLSDNPHTADAHVFVLGEGDPTELAALHPRAEPIVKPFHAEEVASRVIEVIRTRREPETGPELEGDLQQVALFDLLQVFAANRRTGLLSVVSGGVRGQIWLKEGRVVDAVCGFVAGEKALFRVLALSEGQFVFLPDRTAGRQRIDASTDFLLMEAVRHADELKELQTKLPSLATQVHCIAEPKNVEGLSAELVARITASLEEARSIEELLDLVPAHDLEVLRIVAELIDRDVLQAYDAVNRVRFCDPEEVTAMRAAALRLRRPGVEGPVRLGVSGPREDITRFARALGGLEEFIAAPEPPTPAGAGSFGAIGVVAIGGTNLELFSLPPDEELRPLWGAFLAAARVVLIVGDAFGRDRDPQTQSDIRLVRAPIGYERPVGAAMALREAIGPRTR